MKKQRNIRVIGIRRENPDMQQLARAFIELAQHLAQERVVTEAKAFPKAKRSKGSKSSV